jgi:hypothetical protein
MSDHFIRAFAIFRPSPHTFRTNEMASASGGNIAVLGDNEQAVYWLEQAYTEQSNILHFLKTHTYFDRGVRRFADLVRRVGLV